MCPSGRLIYRNKPPLAAKPKPKRTLVVWRWCHGGEWGGSRKGEQRVAVRGIEDRVDPVVRNLFGFGRKSPPEKFSGGGDGGRRMGRGVPIALLRNRVKTYPKIVGHRVQDMSNEYPG
ncbi:hypothetical protein Tco_1458091 [Tanacetum coccineum]